MTPRSSLPPLRVQLQFPGLADDGGSELVVLFGGDEPESGPLLDVAGGGKHAVGPQRDHAVARLAREAERFLD